MTKRPRRPATARTLHPAPPPTGHRHTAVSTGALTALTALFLTACISRSDVAPVTLDRAQPPATTAQTLRHLVDDGIPGAASLTTRDGVPAGRADHGTRPDRSGLRRVTVRQLLDHTTGPCNCTDDPRLSRQLQGKGFGAHR
ncbi:hypothetical protein [Streptomyces nigrescens]